jgi:hypothetical protein
MSVRLRGLPLLMAGAILATTCLEQEPVALLGLVDEDLQ